MRFGKRTLNGILFFSLLGAVLFIFSGSGSAASLTVSVSCSIDNAILSANNDADTGGCTGSGVYGDDQINVPAGTWNVGANVASEGNLAIIGSGMGESIIDAGDSYAGIACNNTSPGVLDLSISGLTIQNTVSSSGAYPLAAINCNLNVSELEITNGREDANIFFNAVQNGVSAQLNISDVHIHDTLGSGVTIAGSGGGITNQIDFNITRLTVYNASSPGKVMGGVSVSAGEDVDNSNHTINGVISNSTFVGNGPNDSYGIFAIAQSPSSTGSTDEVNLALENITLLNHEVASNFPSSGIIVGASTASGSTATATVTTKNVLVANNVAGASVQNCAALNLGSGGTESASIVSLGNNIADDTSCDFTATGDQQNLADLLSTLGPLQDNGGVTPTVALLPGSPAINAGGTVLGLTTDQRGVSRPQGVAFDIGAYEYEGSFDETNQQGNSQSSPSSGSSSPQNIVANELAKTGVGGYVAPFGIMGIASFIIWLLGRRRYLHWRSN